MINLIFLIEGESHITAYYIALQLNNFTLQVSEHMIYKYVTCQHYMQIIRHIEYITHQTEGIYKLSSRLDI